MLCILQSMQSLQALRTFTFFAEKYMQFSESGNFKLIQDLKKVANPGDYLRIKKDSSHEEKQKREKIDEKKQQADGKLRQRASVNSPLSQHTIITWPAIW